MYYRDYMGNMEFYLTTEEEKTFNILLEVVRVKSPETILRLAGGLVRDRLLDIMCSDIDIAVSNMSGLDFAKLIVEYLEERDMSIRMPTVIKANPDQSKHLETAMLEINGLSIDLVNLRKETYADSRIPTIEFGSIEEDAQRRDLTINALYYNLHTKLVEDYVGGIEDLNRGVARTPIDPIQTFIDDPLRIYRCVRFATKYNLEIDKSIIWATRNFKVIESLKTKVSPDRIFKEIAGYILPNGEWKCGCFSIDHPSSAEALELLHNMDLLHILFPNCNINFYQAYYYLINVVSYGFPQDILISTLAIILKDVNLFAVSEDLLEIKCPKDIYNKIINTISSVQFLKMNWTSDIGIRKFLRETKGTHLLATDISIIEFSGNEDFEKKNGVIEKIYEFVEDEGGTKIKSPVTGADLLNNGFNAGKSLGKALSALDDKLLENPRLTFDEALEFCDQFKE